MSGKVCKNPGRRIWAILMSVFMILTSVSWPPVAVEAAEVPKTDEGTVDTSTEGLIDGGG